MEQTHSKLAWLLMYYVELQYWHGIVGVDGGFASDENKYKVDEDNSVVILPEWDVISLPDETLPPEVQ